MTAEQGKPLAELRGEVAYGASFVEFFAEEASASMARPSRHNVAARASSCHRQPAGVVGAITPWNSPFAMITRKVGRRSPSAAPPSSSRRRTRR